MVRKSETRKAKAFGKTFAAEASEKNVRNTGMYVAFEQRRDR
jgi:hypothetical protein